MHKLRNYIRAITKTLSRVVQHEWFVVIVPFLLLGVIIALLTMTKDKPIDSAQLTRAASQLTQATNGELAIKTILMPDPGIIQVEVINGGDEAVTIPQVQVDGAYWDFTVVPSNTITVAGVATFNIPYPWVADELHVVRLITARGATVDEEIVGGKRPPLSQLK